MSANAGELEDVLACIQAAKEIGGVELDPRKAEYEFHFFSRSEATWPDARCEVDLGTVYNLKVNNKEIIIDGFPGRPSYELNQQLEVATEDAIQKLHSQINTLRERQERVSDALRKPEANRQALSAEIHKGINDAKAGRVAAVPPVSQNNCREPTEQSSSDRADSESEISQKPVETDSADANPDNIKAYVTADSLNARTCGLTTCGIVEIFSRGQEVTIYERNGEWSRVSESESAKCQNGTTAIVMRGNDECTPANGIKADKYAAWVATRYLSSEQPNPEPKQNEPNHVQLELHYLSECRRIVKNKLKDPASAKFRNVHFVNKRDTSVVCGEVNAKGGFGGYTGFERFVCGGIPELTVLQSELADFVEFWNSACVK